MSKHYDDEILFAWTCPHCQFTQTDDYAWTSVIQCGECEREWHWDEVITPNDQRRLNRELVALEVSYAEEAYAAECRVNSK